jgi:putative ABC transport system permease protein
MVTLTLRTMRARGRRLLSSGVAIVLGVAFLVGTLVLGDTLSANFTRLFNDVSAGTDVVVRLAATVGSSGAPDQDRGLIDSSLAATVQAVDGVAAVEGQVVGYGSLLGRDGDPIGGNGPPRQAGSWVTDPSLNPYELVEGRAPARPDEVVVNRGAAAAGDLAVGDTTVVQTPEPVTVTIVGIATFGGTDGLGQTTWTAFTLEGAQANVTRQPGKVSTLLATVRPGLDADAVRDRVAAALPPGVEAITGKRLAQERIDAISAEFLTMLRTFLTAFAGIALLVATLTINNAFSITLAQRTRELALVRVVGASRRQLRRSVTFEALLLGAVASAIGAVAGLGVAGLLKGECSTPSAALSPPGGWRCGRSRWLSA